MKFYERTLHSFADSVITKVRRSHDGTLWTAVLDCGETHYPSDPDFATTAPTRLRAVRFCAYTIRRNAQGIGKYAPHSILVPGYDFHWRLAKYWAKKEKKLKARRKSA